MPPFLEQLDRKTRLLVESNLTLRQFESDEQIVAYQAADRDLYVVLGGWARVKIYAETGRVVDFRTLGAGEIFGEVSLIDGGPRSASVVAETSCLVGRMTPDQVWNLIAQSPEFNKALMTRLTMLVRTLTERVLEYSILPGGIRVFRELLRMAEAAGIEGNRAVIDPMPTHQVLADRISSHREAVSRQLSALSRSGLVTRSEGKLIVNDVEALRQMASDIDDL